jgi:cardiolipin synthase
MRTSNFLLFTLCLGLFTLGQNAFGKVYEYTSSNRLTLLEDPKSAEDYKINLVKNAKHHVHIITYFWDDTNFPKRLARELKEANARGVEVRIITNFVMTFGTDIFGKGRKDFKGLSKDTVFSYLSLTPTDNVVATNNYHEKIILIDGKTVVMGGRNVSDSSLTGKDMEVVLEGPIVNQVQDHIKIMFDFSTGLKIKSKCENHSKSYKAKCTQAFEANKFSTKDKNFFPDQKKYKNGEVARMISHEAILKQHKLGLGKKERLLMEDDILNTVTKIKFKKMRGYGYFMMPTEKFKNFIEKSIVQGSEVEMITNSLKSASFSSNKGYIYGLPESKEMVENGLKLYQWQGNGQMTYVHEKVLIFDEDHVIIGSHNFGTGSTSVSNEIVVEIKSERIAARLIEVFDEEKNDSNITNLVDGKFLQEEIDLYKKEIKRLHSSFIGGVIREIY